MKILCCGDSWTQGWGIDETNRWTSMLPDATVKNFAIGGASNFEIKHQLISNLNKDYDVVIIGWSGVSRYRYQKYSFDFSGANDFEFRNSFFEKKSLKSMEDDFLNLNKEVNDTCKRYKIKKLIKFSVFGDFKYLWDEHYTQDSFLDYLSAAQGNIFNYSIPFFEFDFLSECNYKNTKSFAKKYFEKNWDRAIIERNEIRPGKYFLPCGHPNEQGHRIWSEYIKKYIYD